MSSAVGIGLNWMLKKEYCQEKQKKVVPEGSFYRVTNPSPLTSSVTAIRLTIAGGGGGVSTLAEDIDLTVEPLATVNLINGQSAKVYFTARKKV